MKAHGEHECDLDVGDFAVAVGVEDGSDDLEHLEFVLVLYRLVVELANLTAGGKKKWGGRSVVMKLEARGKRTNTFCAAHRRRRPSCHRT
ncbi:hypothetical protein ACFX11_011506 [Malus domestica]